MADNRNIVPTLAKYTVPGRARSKEIEVLPQAAEAEISTKLGVGRAYIQQSALEANIIPARYLRNIGTIGIKGQLTLLKSTVAVIGCGGLGGLVVDLLARMGVGTLILVDDDVFEDNNLNRQVLCTEADLGQPKVAVAYERVLAVNPAVDVRCFQQRLGSENARAMLQGAHVVVDALDNLPSRFELERAAHEQGIPLVHGAIAGFLGQVMTIYPGDPGLRDIYGELGSRQRGIEVEMGNPAATPAVIASMQVQEVTKVLTGVGEPLRGRLFYIDTNSGEASGLKLRSSDDQNGPGPIQPATNSELPQPISFVGTSGSGKTTLLVELIAELSRRGLKVAAAKHSHSLVEIDNEGKDSWRFRLAGAKSSAFISSGQATVFYQLTAKEATTRLKKWFPDADIVIMEGGKFSSLPKVLVYRDGVSEIMSPWPKNIIAIAGDVQAAKDAGLPNTLPGFGWGDGASLADFLLQQQYKQIK
ncbi:MAG: molybdopterin-guanine dinucleotide biosynthesis protein B [bacterium]|jgi:molybdopterin-guanine dinucleotide biosynthesis protein MobB